MTVWRTTLRDRGPVRWNAVFDRNFTLLLRVREPIGNMRRLQCATTPLTRLDVHLIWRESPCHIPHYSLQVSPLDR